MPVFGVMQTYLRIACYATNGIRRAKFKNLAVMRSNDFEAKYLEEI